MVQIGDRVVPRIREDWSAATDGGRNRHPGQAPARPLGQRQRVVVHPERWVAPSHRAQIRGPRRTPLTLSAAQWTWPVKQVRTLCSPLCEVRGFESCGGTN
jgi:hypothetical protein